MLVAFNNVFAWLHKPCGGTLVGGMRTITEVKCSECGPIALENFREELIHLEAFGEQLMEAFIEEERKGLKEHAVLESVQGGHE